MFHSITTQEPYRTTSPLQTNNEPVVFPYSSKGLGDVEFLSGVVPIDYLPEISVSGSLSNDDRDDDAADGINATEGHGSKAISRAPVLSYAKNDQNIEHSFSKLPVSENLQEQLSPIIIGDTSPELTKPSSPCSTKEKCHLVDGATPIDLTVERTAAPDDGEIITPSEEVLPVPPSKCILVAVIKVLWKALMDAFEDLKVAPSQFPKSGSGTLQILIFVIFYVFLLMLGQKMVGRGAELLLLIRSLRPIVGSIIIPLVSNVPDFLLVLLSGLRVDRAPLAVAALTGSTTFTFGLPFVLGFLSGKVPMVDGVCRYDEVQNSHYGSTATDGAMILPGSAPSAQKCPFHKLKILTQAVHPFASFKRTLIYLLGSLLPFLILQISTWLYMGIIGTTLPHIHSGFHHINLIIAGVGFLGAAAILVCEMYKRRQFEDQVHGFRSWSGPICEKITSLQTEALEHGYMTLEGIFADIDLDSELNLAASDNTEQSGDDEQEQLVKSTESGKKRFLRFKSEITALVLPFFEARANAPNGTISEQDCYALFSDLHGNIDSLTFQSLLLGRTRGNGQLTLTSVVDVVAAFLMVDLDRTADVKEEVPVPKQRSSLEHLPSDLKRYRLTTQKFRVVCRSAQLLFFGTVLSAIATDVMAASLIELASRTSLPQFCLFFCAAPLVSQLSDGVAAYYIARRKTRQGITVAYSSAVVGSAYNNTFLLGLLMLQFWSHRILWNFVPETFIMIFTCAISATFLLPRRIIKWTHIIFLILTCLTACAVVYSFALFPYLRNRNLLILS